VTSSTRLSLILFLGLPATLWAQKAKDSWSNLNGLKAGQGIEVIESSLKHHGGEFVSVSDDVVTLQEKGPDVSISVKTSSASQPLRVPGAASTS
jgi:hypothetical protein